MANEYYQYYFNCLQTKTEPNNISKSRRGLGEDYCIFPNENQPPCKDYAIFPKEKSQGIIM